MEPPREDSPPDEFDDYIRELRRTSEVPGNELEEYFAGEILAETRKDDGSLWVSFVDSFIASIRRVIGQTPSGDQVLQGVVRRLQDAKLAAKA